MKHIKERGYFPLEVGRNYIQMLQVHYQSWHIVIWNLKEKQSTW